MLNSKNHLWFVSPTLGTSSEVWMYRQASGLTNFSTRVVTLKYVNHESYPANEFVISKVPKSPILIRLWRKIAKSMVNPFLPSEKHFRWYESLFAQHPADVMLCQYGTTANRMTSIAKALGIPLVVHFHGFDITVLLQIKPAYVEELKSNLAGWAGCVVVANYQKKILQNFGVPDSKIHVIPCGVPAKLFRREHESTSTDCEFLSVGRLTAKKAPLSTIRAFGLCLKSAPNSRLSIIGDGELMEKCRELTAELSIEDQVTFHGAKPTDFVRKAMSKASVFVQHSITPPTGDKEGWPVALAEAAASELPIVSTNHASIPEQVVEGETGFLVPEGDWKQMAHYMQLLANDSEMREKFGAASRVHITNWDSEKQISLLENTLLKVAQENQSA